MNERFKSPKHKRDFFMTTLIDSTYKSRTQNLFENNIKSSEEEDVK